MRPFRELWPAAVAAAPTVLAMATAGAGIMLLASGATPSDPFRLAWLAQVAPPLLIEIAHFASSILGLILVLLAFGLSRRLDAAWAASAVMLPVASVLALAKGVNWEESAVLAALVLVLAPFREAFPRHSRLVRMEISVGWMVSALAALGGVALLGVWSFQNVGYGDTAWWRLMADADAERAIRSSAGAAIALLVIGIWRLIVTPATPPIAGEADPNFSQVRAILAAADTAEPQSNLALLGDKRFLFSASGKSFLMFGVRGRSWIAMGAPVGRADEQLELLWRFRELADAHAARPGVYGVGPDDLPDLVELGFSIQKIGESATVPLDGFSLEGRRREALRRNWRRAGEGGACFEVIGPEAVPDILPELERVSDSWLEGQTGGEKSFSLGGFDPGYVSEFPVAVVRVEGRVVAFATLWTTASKVAFSMDLMRYSKDAPKNVMDYLFVELLQWGRKQDYDAFDFGMAPLAGLEDRPLAPIMSRVGRLLFEQGEEIYNFRGVRRYKDKYDPTWQARYIAAPQKWAIPFLMADVGLLSSSGVDGLARIPRQRTPLATPAKAA